MDSLKQLRATALANESLWATLIFALAFVLRAWNLDGQSLTNDEIEDLLIARQDGDVEQMLRGARRFPPLYHLLGRAWMAVFPSDLGARWLSVVLGMAVLIAMWRLGRWIAGPRGGIAVALLVAVSPFFIWYSQETRVYCLFLALAALSLNFFFRAIETERTADWVCFAMTSVAGMYTHYYFAFLLLAISLWRAFQTWRRPRLLFHTGLVLIISIALIPLVWLAMQDVEGGWGHSRFSGFGIDALGYTYVSFITGYTLGPSLRGLHTMSLAEALWAFAPWLLVLSLPVLLLARSFLRLIPRVHSLWLVLAMLFPVLLVGVISELAPWGYNVRHVVWVSIPVILCLGIGLSVMSFPSAVVVFLMLTASWAVALYGRHYSMPYRNEDARAVSDYLEIHADQDEPVFVISSYMSSIVKYYLDKPLTVTGLSDIQESCAGLAKTLSVIEATTSSDQPYWLLTSRTFHGDPNGCLVARLQQDGQLELQAGFAGFRIYRFAGP